MSDTGPGKEDRLEAVLKGLTPAAPQFDRDRLMYRAGQSAQGARHMGWHLAAWTALLGLLAGIGGTYLSLRWAWQPVERVIFVEVHVPTPTPTPPTQAMPPTPKETPATTSPLPELALGTPWSFFSPDLKPLTGYLQQRDQALRWGVEALPSTVPVSGGHTTLPPGNLLQMQAKLMEKMPGF